MWSTLGAVLPVPRVLLKADPQPSGPVLNYYYSSPGYRPSAQVIKCVGFFLLHYVSSARKWTNCAIVPMRPLRDSHANEVLGAIGLEEMKRVGFFKNAYRKVRKAYFDRRTTQSEFCFEINILCDRRSVQRRTKKSEVRKTALQNKLTLTW